MLVLTLNAGSSTQKCCLFDADDSLLWQAVADWTQVPDQVVVRVQVPGAERRWHTSERDRRAVLEQMLAALTTGETAAIPSLAAVGAVAHRVVHGGSRYCQATLVTAEVLGAIRELSALAPLHNPLNAEGIAAMGEMLGAGIPQVAVFDTAFHQTLPPAAYTYGIPRWWREQGVRRYGFHGISHQYVAQRAGVVLGRDWRDLHLITCHLGNGCSLAAVRQGQCVDTTMGLTPLDGIVMGTRPGSLDPGILLQWWRQGLSLEQVDHLLNRECGLKGLSGLSSDLRQVLAGVEAGDPDCQLAVDVFVHRLRAGIGAMLASLGSLDVLVFTAGIGENSPLVRQRACAGWLGIELDTDLNQRTFAADRVISREGSRVQVLVIHTQEELALAQQARQLLAAPPT
ncbi:MAG: acetate kinase [Thermostichales cyanobacterium SZTDM-1c_bins_54]